MRNASFVRVGSIVLALTGGLFSTHCSSDDTPVVGDETDTGVLDDTGTTAETSTSESGDDTSTASETGDDTSTASETGGDATDGGSDTPADAGCGALSATAVDVYVDKSSAKPSVGTLACPFHSIQEATDLAAVMGRTIHVKAGNYTEAGALIVKGGVTLVGDGLATTKITNAATCTGGSMCAVEVQNNGTLDGFTINGTGNGIVTGATDGPATVRNVLVTGAQDGILALGVLRLTGGVQLNSNKLNGLHANAAAARTVTISGTGNELDSNDGKGIFVEGSSKLDATGAEAKNNKGGGIYIASTVAAATPHLVTGMTVTGNGAGGAADGINVASTSSLKLRDTVLQSNTHHGLSFVYSTTNALDIGATGGNTFSSATDAKKNGAAGLCLDGSGATGSVNGNGNKWAACGVLGSPVTETPISSGDCSSFSGSKVEIAYKKSASGGTDPVAITAVTGCTVAP